MVWVERFTTDVTEMEASAAREKTARGWLLWLWDMCAQSPSPSKGEREDVRASTIRLPR